MATALKIFAAPTTLPVSLADVKAHLRVDTTDENDHIQTLIEAVTSQLDGFTGTMGRCLSPQTWDLYLDAFPCGDDAIRLPFPSLIGVTWVKYTNTAGAWTTISTDDYELDLISPDGWIVPVAAVGWPTDVLDSFNVVWVRFQAGYADGVPAAIKHAIKLMVADLYEHRETYVVGQTIAETMAVQSLLEPFRRRPV